MTADKQISDYMRAMQRRSAAARWAGKSPEQRSQEMRRLRALAKKRQRTRKTATARLAVVPPAAESAHAVEH